MKTIIVFFLLSLNFAYAQVVSPEGIILGNNFHELDFKQADSVLNIKSYKEPVKIFRSIKWRNGGCSTIFSNIYFLKFSGIKFQIKLRGSDDHYMIEITNRNKRKKIEFIDVTLGTTKLGELDLTFSQNDTDIYIDEDGREYFSVPYKSLNLAVYGNRKDLNSDNWKDKVVDKLIWKK